MNYVYKFINYYDEIIYVGKTRDIKTRMRQHFSEGHLPQECYDSVKEIKYAEVGISQYDAEVIETILINELKPQYNTDKVFMERSELSSFKSGNLEWKNIYIEKTDFSLRVLFNKPKLDVFNTNLTDIERCTSLICYNINKIQYNKGFYNYYFNDLFEKDANLLYDIIEIYNHASWQININESDIDEYVTPQEDEICVYAAFNIKDVEADLGSINSVLLALKYKLIFKITDEIYGIPLHNTENIKLMSAIN